MDAGKLVQFVSARFSALADPEKAGPMAAYMKSGMPFLGIPKPDRVPVYRAMKRRFVPAGPDDYVRSVEALWSLPNREEKYAAIEYALQHRDFIRGESKPLYERLIREGAWWDFVDAVAISLVGEVYRSERERLAPVMEAWTRDGDLWIRRSAVLCQLKHKRQTDWEQLSDFCVRLAPEKEFFIRKAIGWALREYSKSEPERVMKFLASNREELSGLTYREAARHLVREGLMGE